MEKHCPVMLTLLEFVDCPVNCLVTVANGSCICLGGRISVGHGPMRLQLFKRNCYTVLYTSSGNRKSDKGLNFSQMPLPNCMAIYQKKGVEGGFYAEFTGWILDSAN